MTSADGSGRTEAAAASSSAASRRSETSSRSSSNSDAYLPPAPRPRMAPVVPPSRSAASHRCGRSGDRTDPSSSPRMHGPAPAGRPWDATTMTDAVVGFREGVGSARAVSNRDVRLGRSSPVCVPPLTRLVPPQPAGTPLARPSALSPHLRGPGPPWRGMRSAPRC
jgi:hypothetical protein